MPSHISDVHNTGQCGTLQTLAQSKGAYADLILKEQRRALAGPRINPSNQPTEWFGAAVNGLPAPSQMASPHSASYGEGVPGSPKGAPNPKAAALAKMAPKDSPSRAERGQESYILQMMAAEQKKQAKHEAELKQFKQLSVLQLVRPEDVRAVEGRDTANTNHDACMVSPSRGRKSPTRFLGESVDIVLGPKANVAQPKLTREGHLAKRADHSPSSKGGGASPFSDANQAATFRAQARKDRQQQHNKAMGNYVTDQSKTSPMFMTALKDPVTEENVLLCDDSVHDRRRFEQRKHVTRDLVERVMKHQQGGPNSSPTKLHIASPKRTPPTVGDGASPSRLPPLPASPGNRQRGVLPRLSPEEENAARDYALLGLMHEQKRLFEQQVELEAKGAWVEAATEQKLRQKRTVDVSELSLEEGLAMGPAGVVQHGALDTRNRRQRILQYMEDNKNIRRGAQSALETMHTATISPPKQRRSASTTAMAVSKAPNARPHKKGHHQPSSLFPHAGSRVYSGEGTKNHSMR